MDGAITGQLDTRDEIMRMSAALGDMPAAESENRPARIGTRVQKQILEAAMGDGVEWINAIEGECRQALRRIHNAAIPGVKDATDEELGLAVKAVIMAQLEPTEETSTFTETADTKGTWRSSRLKSKRWSDISAKQQKELADWKAGKRKEPVWRLKARQQTTRMRDAWNQRYNEQSITRAIENEEVIYLQFTLGRARNHTDICKSREGWVLKKDDPKLALERPPLHHGCKSKWLPVTRTAAKQYGIKRSTPEDIGDYPPADGFGGFGS